MRHRPDMRDVEGDLSPMVEPPAKLKPKRMPNGQIVMQGGLGDYAQTGEPHQKYWQVLRTAMPMPPQMPVLQPPVAISTESRLNHMDLAKAICDCLSCTTIQTKAPNWIEPPSSALMIDQSTSADGVTIPAGSPGAFTEVIRLIVPDRWYMVLNKFGNTLELDTAFMGVDWQIRINDKPMPFQQYLGSGVVQGGIFSGQLGDPVNPTLLSMPIIAKYGDVVRVMARSNDDSEHTAWARLMGWVYSVANIDQSGDPCTPNGMIPLWSGGNTPIIPVVT